MAANAGIYAIVVLLLVVLIVILGFTCYMFRNFCPSIKRKSTKRQSAALQGPTSNLEGGPNSLGSQTERVYKTTTDEDPSQKLTTFDQILKKEEKSAFSLHSLKLLQQQQQLQSQSQSQSHSQLSSQQHQSKLQSSAKQEQPQQQVAAAAASVNAQQQPAH